MTRETEQRAAVVRLARLWVGTPYHHHAQLRGVGCDCATLLKCVFEDAGVLPPVDLGHYSPQWHLHQDEPLYENLVVRHGGRLTETEQPGDVVLYRAANQRRGRAYQFAHGAILVGPGRIVHAYAPSGEVLEGSEAEFGQLIDAERRVYTMWPGE